MPGDHAAGAIDRAVWAQPATRPASGIGAKVDAEDVGQVNPFTFDQPFLDLLWNNVTAVITNHVGTPLAYAWGQAGFAITYPGTETLAGNIAAALAEADDTTVEISYWLAPEARGQGLATRAVQELCSWIHDSWPQVVRVALWTHIDNAASQRVALAAGFQHLQSEDGYRVVAGQRWPARWYTLSLH